MTSQPLHRRRAAAARAGGARPRRTHPPELLRATARACPPSFFLLPIFLTTLGSRASRAARAGRRAAAPPQSRSHAPPPCWPPPRRCDRQRRTRSCGQRGQRARGVLAGASRGLTPTRGASVVVGNAANCSGAGRRPTAPTAAAAALHCRSLANQAVCVRARAARLAAPAPVPPAHL